MKAFQMSSEFEIVYTTQLQVRGLILESNLQMFRIYRILRLKAGSVLSLTELIVDADLFTYVLRDINGLEI